MSFIVSLFLLFDPQPYMDRVNTQEYIQEAKTSPYVELLPDNLDEPLLGKLLKLCWAEYGTGDHKEKMGCLVVQATTVSECEDGNDFKTCYSKPQTTNKALNAKSSFFHGVARLDDERKRARQKAKDKTAHEMRVAELAAEKERQTLYAEQQEKTLEDKWANFSPETRKACRAGPSKSIRTKLSRQVLKQIAHDPNSIEIVSVGSANPYAQGIYICTFDWFVSFRGTNSFGAMVLNEIEVVATRNDAGWYVVSQDY